MSSYDEHLISMAGGDGDELDAIQLRADRAAVGWRGTESADQVIADRFDLLALVRTQQATLAAVLELANNAGRCGWKLSADEVRKALKG